MKITRPDSVTFNAEDGKPTTVSIAGGSPEAVLAEDGTAGRYEGTSLKDLCKLAEHHAGRPRLFDLFKEHGVVKLGADAAKDASLRAAVLELVP